MSGKARRECADTEMHGDFMTSEGGEMCAMPPETADLQQVEQRSGTPTLDAAEEAKPRRRHRDRRPRFEDLPREEQLELANRFSPTRERELRLADARAFGPSRQREVALLRARATGPDATPEEAASLSEQADDLERQYDAEAADASAALEAYQDEERSTMGQYR